MDMNRGEVWWASLPDASGSSPGYRRPVLVLQSNAFNKSNIQTIIVLAITTNLKLADAPGNVFISKLESGLPRDSVINISQVVTLDKGFLTEFVSTLPVRNMQKVEEGLRLVLSL
jgi:mRNA interferase MazF